ncbi:MAG: TetR/AcrR family transcriptional regulator [Alphaproteobacteria bacterium]|nr:TetR/AcrR family transcriptional regulator [Alphaproteobacteria bacterium]
MTETHKKNPRSAGGGLRSELIDIAVHMIEADGSEALSLRRVARKAGVSHMAPYRHFDSKNALLAAVAETGFRDLVSTMDAAVISEKSDGLKSRAIGLAYVQFARLRPALFRLMFGPLFSDETRFPDLTEAMRLAKDRSFAAVSLLQAASDRPDGNQIELTGVAIWSLVHGLANLLIDDQLDLPAGREAEEAYIENVLDILGRIAPANKTG